MTKNKKQVNNKRHMKKNVKDLIVFIVILTILGLIFMNFLFYFFISIRNHFNISYFKLV